MKIELNEGEIYVGHYGLSPDETIHVILLPGDNDDATWEAQMEWAKSIGGDLPNRIEQAMLWANHRDQFQKDWYWSNETYHSESGWAWCQDFSYGYQSSSNRSLELRARAVRRIVERKKSIGGDLPNRIEQAMLWANHRDQFQKDWYWSNETYHSESGWAWCQDFSYGYQSSSNRSLELRARAVRRIVERKE